jgi:type 1 glutamine amidotransferase
MADGDHPMVWQHCVGRGRALYSALGHQAKSYDEPELQALVEGALAWALRVEGVGCE